MPKVNREGQASTLSDYQISKIRSKLKGPYQLIWDIAIFTGERWGAIRALKVDDCYDPSGSVREYITFKWHTSTVGRKLGYYLESQFLEKKHAKISPTDNSSRRNRKRKAKSLTESS